MRLTFKGSREIVDKIEQLMREGREAADSPAAKASNRAANCSVGTSRKIQYDKQVARVWVRFLVEEAPSLGCGSN